MERVWSNLQDSWEQLGSPWRSIFLPPLTPSGADVRVELGLQRAFLLDDPVAGVIGNTDYVLSGEEFVDITSFAFAVSTSRGKNTELDKYKSAQISVALHNQNRFFDPDYVESPFAGELVPRRGIRVMSNSVPIVTGRVTDWNLSYAPGNQAEASIEAQDNFLLFSTQFVTAGTVVAETTGDRIGAVLDMASVNWPVDDRRIDTGQSTLGSAVLDGSENALAYLQEVELSEIGGSLFISREGYLTFKDRTATPQVDGAVLFSDDGAGIPFQSLEIDYGSENLYNQVEVTSPAGTAVANDLLSQSQYGISSQTYSTLLSDQTQLNAAATWLIGRYSRPVLRVQSLTVNLDSLSELQRNELLALELADVAEVRFTPNGVGDPVTKPGLIIGINHNISPERHDVTFAFSPVQTNVFIIGDPEFGIIGAGAPGVLGY